MSSQREIDEYVLGFGDNASYECDGWRAYTRLDAPLPCGGILHIFESFDPAPHGGCWTWTICGAPPDADKFLSPYHAVSDALLMCPEYTYGNYLQLMRDRAKNTLGKIREEALLAVATLENWRDYP